MQTAALLLSTLLLAGAESPNVVLIITDDQGYGDIAAHGNPQIKTPALDKLHAESVRLTDFHVDPTCSPTRSALMSGRYSTRTGVWHTIQGRSLMDPREITLAEVFAAGGYRTGLFGKWHLGDNWPCRPQDQGFQHTLIHGGGGVGQTPDAWGNDYFDDTYLFNGKWQKYEGYCTDIWFDGALSFIEANREQPFFACIATNAPHGPYNVAPEYSEPYKKMGILSPRAEFYGMITNIDENIARLRKQLDEWKLTDNTLLIFMTDNGTAAGAGKGGFNAGMRGQKGAAYDGGHRVPCFLHWPAGKLTGGREVTQLTAHIDLLPTLAELCGLKLTAEHRQRLDGTSLAALLRGGKVAWPERTLFVHSQRIEIPEKWRTCAVMTDRWRLIDGRELYDIQADPGQQTDLAAAHPDTVKTLRAAYEEWYQSLSDTFDDYVRIGLGSPQERVTLLTCHDWHEPTNGVPWPHELIRRNLLSNGFWAVDVQQAGKYRITLRLRPEPGEPLNARRAEIRLDELEASQQVAEGSDAAVFELQLPPGPARLQTWLDRQAESARGAYYVSVERLE